MSARPFVVELGTTRAVAWAGKLLADAGCEVLKLEPPGGDPARARGPFPASGPHPDHSGEYIAANGGKTARVLDLATEGGTLAMLLRDADGLVLDLAPDAARAHGLDAATLRERFPRLVVLSITPFGLVGPRAHYHATELTMAHGGGWAALCPATHTDPNLPPLKIHGEHCAMMSAVAAATAFLATLRDTQASAVGEHIDFSIQAYVANVLEMGVPAVVGRGAVPFRYHPRSLLPWRILEAKDGPVFVVCIEQDQWERLVEFMGKPEWAQLEIFADIPSRAANQDVLHSLLQEFVGEWTADELFHGAQAHRVGVSPVYDYAGMHAAAHPREREFFGTVAQPGVGDVPLMRNAVYTNAGRLAELGPAPALPKNGPDIEPRATTRPRPVRAAGTRPLEGIRIVDLSWAWAGPFCGMYLAHLGAEVIRVESSVRPDLYRRFTVYTDEFEPSLDRSAMFGQWNQGKRSMVLALDTAEGKAVLRDLVAVSDVVVQNFATGVMERLGIGYDVLSSINPGIVLASISGFGQRGPWRNYLGYGPSAAALTGLCAATGYVGGGPEELGLSMPDPTAGITAAYGVIAALLRRDASGKGEHIDVSLWEATAALGIDGWMQYAMQGRSPERIGNRDPHMAPHGCWRCVGDDAWVSIAVQGDAEWKRFAELLGQDVAADPRFATLAARKANEDALEAIVADWCAPQDRWTVTRLLQARGIAAFPSLSCREILDDAHLNARGFVERLPHPAVGVRAHTGIPWIMHTRANGVRTAAPCLGVDTDDVLRTILRYDNARIDALRAGGTLK